MAFAPSDVASQENWNGAVQSRKINKNEMSLMVGVLVNDIIVPGEQDTCDEFFGQLKQRFQVKTLGEHSCTLVALSSVTGTT